MSAGEKQRQHVSQAGIDAARNDILAALWGHGL
jgi:hypothetical protein